MPGFSVKMTGPGGGSFQGSASAPPPPRPPGPKAPPPPNPAAMKKASAECYKKFEDTMKYRKEAVNEGEKIKAANKLSGEVASWIDNLRFDNAAKMAGGAALMVLGPGHHHVEGAMILASNHKQILAVMKDPAGKSLTDKLGQAIGKLNEAKSNLERILPALAKAAAPPPPPRL